MKKTNPKPPIHQCFACGTHAFENMMNPFARHDTRVVTWVCIDCAQEQQHAPQHAPSSDDTRTAVLA